MTTGFALVPKYWFVVAKMRKNTAFKFFYFKMIRLIPHPFCYNFAIFGLWLPKN